MIEVKCKQRSDEWFKCRSGIPTAGGLRRIMTSKFAISTQMWNYAMEIVMERFGIAAERVKTPAMQHGVDYEDEAAIAYSFDTGLSIREVGFIYYDEKKKFGCSPDRMVEGNGLLEIKCPQPKTMHKYLSKGVLPTAYMQQVYGQMLVCDADWCDFFAYHPDPSFQNLLVRVYPDPEIYSMMLKNLEKFFKVCSTLHNLVEEKINV